MICALNDKCIFFSFSSYHYELNSPITETDNQPPYNYIVHSKKTNKNHKNPTVAVTEKDEPEKIGSVRSSCCCEEKQT